MFKNQEVKTYWATTGKLQSRAYYNSEGNIDGKYQEWYPDGQLHLERYYTNGKEVNNSFQEWKNDSNIRYVKMILPK